MRGVGGGVVGETESYKITINVRFDYFVGVWTFITVSDNGLCRCINVVFQNRKDYYRNESGRREHNVPSVVPGRTGPRAACARAHHAAVCAVQGVKNSSRDFVRVNHGTGEKESSAKTEYVVYVYPLLTMIKKYKKKAKKTKRQRDF